MKLEHLLISIVGLCFSFLVMFVGVLCLITPQIFVLIQARAFFIGLGLLVFGALFLLLCMRLNRRRYLLFKMGGVSVEDRLITHFAEQTLQKLFPGHQIECAVIVKSKGKVEIMANIPYVSNERQESVLEHIETALSATLREQCQFKREFIFNVGFLQPSQKQHNGQA